MLHLKDPNVEAIRNAVHTSDKISLVVVVAEGCDKFDGRLYTEIMQQVNQHKWLINVYKLCYTSVDDLFPRPLTQAVYFFTPRSSEPVFMRTNYSPDSQLKTDLYIVRDVMQGETYAQASAKYGPVQEYQDIDAMLLNESTDEFPSTFRMLRNFATEMWWMTKERLQGRPALTDAQTAYTRMQICEGCPLFKEGRCIRCGCAMSLKVHVKTSTCPEHKW